MCVKRLLWRSSFKCHQIAEVVLTIPQRWGDASRQNKPCTFGTAFHACLVNVKNKMQHISVRRISEQHNTPRDLKLPRCDMEPHTQIFCRSHRPRWTWSCRAQPELFFGACDWWILLNPGGRIEAQGRKKEAFKGRKLPRPGFSTSVSQFTFSQ